MAPMAQAATPTTAMVATASGISSSKNSRPAGVARAMTKAVAIEPSRTAFHSLSGRISSTSTHSAERNNARRAPVRAWVSDAPLSCTRSKPAKVATAATAPAGIEKLATRRTNPGRLRVSFGARARKNAGMPMVRLEMIVRCRGKNGKARSVTPMANASSAA